MPYPCGPNGPCARNGGPCALCGRRPGCPGPTPSTCAYNRACGCGFGSAEQARLSPPCGRSKGGLCERPKAGSSGPPVAGNSGSPMAGNPAPCSPCGFIGPRGPCGPCTASNPCCCPCKMMGQNSNPCRK